MEKKDEITERFQSCVDQLGALTELLASNNDAGIVLSALQTVTAGLIASAPADMRQPLAQYTAQEILRMVENAHKPRSIQ